MSEGTSVGPFFTFLALLLFFLLSNRGKKKKQEPRRIVPPKQVLKAPPPQAALKQTLKKFNPRKEVFHSKEDVISYKVEKRKETSFLKNSWQDKNSLKKAFILSEVLKRVDEKDPF